jgi:NTP pyrophosphatase (non-canonical NTP hydrolase)
MTLHEYQTKALSTAIYPLDNQRTYLSLALCEEAGEVAGKIKKVMRDCGGTFAAKDNLAIAHELGDVLWYLANLANATGYSLEEVARLNIEKIEHRVQNNTLHGSGDER